MKLLKFCLIILSFSIFTCENLDEFSQKDSDFYLQKRVSVYDVLGFAPARPTDWHDLSMRGFIMKGEPYFAVKTSYANESTPGIYIINKDLVLVKKLTQVDLTDGAGITWDPAMSFWTIAASDTDLFIAFNPQVKVVSTNPGLVFRFDLENFSYQQISSLGGTETFVVGTLEGMIYQSIFNGACYIDNVGSSISGTTTNYSLSSSIYGGYSESGVYIPSLGASADPIYSYHKFFKKGNQYTIIEVCNSNVPSNFGVPSFQTRTDTSLAIFAGSITPGSYRALNPELNLALDGTPQNSEVYIDLITMTSGGLLVPYPSGRDRLMDPVSGKVLHTFQLVEQSDKDNGTSKDRYNWPRCYVDGKDVWFMYDVYSQEFKRMAGWWL